MKLIILSTDPTILKWKSLKKKIARLETVLKVWEVGVKYKDTKPDVVNGRITHSWIKYLANNNYKDGYDTTAVHMSDKQRKAWGIKPSLLGSNPNTKQLYGDFYFWSDENTKNKKHNGDEQFFQTFGEEMCHDYFQKTGLPDITHAYRDKYIDITGLLESLDWTLYQKAVARDKQISLMQQLVLFLKQKLLNMQTIKNPFPDFPVSQPFGERAPEWYPRTKHHIGTDFPTPKYTPIPAPVDGLITQTGYSATMGNWLELKSEDHYWYFLHLAVRPKKKACKQGDIIGFTGNSGVSTGSHCHVEVWNRKRDISLLNEQNFRNYVIDIETLWN